MSDSDVPPQACPFCVLDGPDVTVYADALVQALISRRPINRFREEFGHAARADVASAIGAQLEQAT